MVTSRLKRILALGCAIGALAVAPAFSSQEVVFEDPRQLGRAKKALKAQAEKTRVWGLVQRIVVDVKVQNETPVPVEEVEAADRSWRAGSPPPDLLQALATNDCAEALQAVLSSSPGLASAFVSDRSGTLVCLTADVGGYSMATESLFIGSFNGGDGVPFVTKPHRDPILGLDVVEISVPVRDPSGTIGVLTVVRILNQTE